MEEMGCEGGIAHREPRHSPLWPFIKAQETMMVLDRKIQLDRRMGIGKEWLPCLPRHFPGLFRPPPFFASLYFCLPPRLRGDGDTRHEYGNKNVNSAVRRRRRRPWQQQQDEIGVPARVGGILLPFPFLPATAADSRKDRNHMRVLHSTLRSF